MNSGPEGLILLDKPSGITSFQSLQPIKNKLPGVKIGHAGTLDPFASGLLVVLAGRATRLVRLFMDLPKTYRATFRLGEQTDTLDSEGRVVAEAPLPAREGIQRALEALTGEIEQVPPDYSAIHLNGARAYQLRRRGIAPELKARKVTVYRIEVLETQPAELTLRILCSRGTYIRALARDLGLLAETRAYAYNLEREAIGGFRLEEAVSPSDFDPPRHLIPPRSFLPRVLTGEPLRLSAPGVARFRQGLPIRMTDLEETRPAAAGFSGAADEKGALIGLLEQRGDSWRALFKMAEEET